MADGDHEALVEPICRWYEASARDLPWRRAGTTPWAILVSEFMAQQTPVARVIEPWAQWLDRWPTPAALAAATAGDAVRAWGRLGYPRRALRLHAAATAIVVEHDGRVPDELADLRALPGVGEYTAAAVLAFAFGKRAMVADTNVRRVLARLVSGRAQPAPSLTAAERRLACDLMPDADAEAALWAAASMELGALVCTAQNPDCRRCPVTDRCAWLALDRPRYDGPARRQPRYAGSDRQCRGALLDIVRTSHVSVDAAAMVAGWPVAAQRERALAGLLADGLICVHDDGYRLP